LLTIGLRAFEMHLRQADAWLRGEEERGILYRRNIHLPPAQRAAARAQSAAALAQIAVLAERSDRAAAEEDLGAAIDAQLSVDWANLSDGRSAKLRRCGEVDLRLADLLVEDLCHGCADGIAMVGFLGDAGQNIPFVHTGGALSQCQPEGQEPCRQDEAAEEDQDRVQLEIAHGNEGRCGPRQ
jgi:hypothetical protein